MEKMKNAGKEAHSIIESARAEASEEKQQILQQTQNEVSRIKELFPIMGTALLAGLLATLLLPVLQVSGGSMNPTLLAHIADCLPGCEVMTNEQLGLDSNAKEAVAFAVLANEAMYGQPNNAPGATGAAHPVVMGKISQ